MFSNLFIHFLQATPPPPTSTQVESGFGYVIAAYAVIWILVFGYIYSLNRRQSKLRHDIEILKEEESERKQQVELEPTGEATPVFNSTTRQE